FIRNLHGKCWMVFENLCTYYTTKRLQIQWFKGVSGYSADTNYREAHLAALDSLRESWGIWYEAR
ncbi:MAG: hypothetical protein ACOX78_09585, partial [Lachnospiraceae bacterium]